MAELKLKKGDRVRLVNGHPWEGLTGTYDGSELNRSFYTARQEAIRMHTVRLTPTEKVPDACLAEDHELRRA